MMIIKLIILLLAIYCSTITIQALSIQLKTSINKDPLIHNDEFIREINQAQKYWIAGRNVKFDGKKKSDLVKMLGKYDHYSNKNGGNVIRTSVVEMDLPTNYTLITDTKYMNCTQLHRIRNQDQCAACYAFGVTEMVADRFCIASQSKYNVVLSPQFILSCDEYEGNCYGGDPGNTLLYVQNYGIVTDSCLPFLARNGTNISCPNKCLDGSNWKLRYKVKNPTQIPQDDIQGMQQSILQGGSIIASFNVYEDFAHYKGGVYVHTGGDYLGGHVVKIVGWGETPTGVPYWMVANSWGTDWGLSGYFLIIRGKNECNFERYVWQAIPSF